MKKLLRMIAATLVLLLLAACGGEPEHTVSYVDGKAVTLFDRACVAVFTQYTNASAQTAVPADEVSVKAFQNGIELSPIVPTGEKTEGYIQCDASVQSTVTADVVWIFQLEDTSPVSVEISGEDAARIELS